MADVIAKMSLGLYNHQLLSVYYGRSAITYTYILHSILKHNIVFGNKKTLFKR